MMSSSGAASDQNFVNDISVSAYGIFMNDIVKNVLFQ